MHIKSFRQKDRYGNEMAVEFFEVPEMQAIPQYDHPGDPKGPDTVPAWLTPGEYVVNAEAVRMFEPEIEAMNEAGKTVQAQQGGTIPEGGTIPNEPVYEADGGFISGLFQSAVDAITMPTPPAGAGYELRRHKDGSIGKWAGNTFLGTYKEAEKEDKGTAFSDFLGVQRSQGGPIPPMYAQDGAPVPLGIRQNNPGNLRPGSPFIGIADDSNDSGYLQFEDDDYGLRAMAKTLGTYADEYDIGTVDALVDRYAPKGDNSEESRNNYKSVLSETLGVAVDEPFDLKATRDKLMPAMIGFENANQMPYTQEQINMAIQAAGTDDPEAVKAILEGPPPSERSSFSLIGSAEASTLNNNVDNEAEKYRPSGFGPSVPDMKVPQIGQSKIDTLERSIERSKDLLANTDPNSQYYDRRLQNVLDLEQELKDANSKMELKTLIEAQQEDFEANNKDAEKRNKIRDLEGKLSGNPTTDKVIQDQIDSLTSDLEKKDTDSPAPTSGVSFANELIDQTKGSTTPNNPQDVEAAAQDADPSILEKSFDFIKGVFSDVLNERELVRMAVMYTGSRMLGYEHQGSLNFAAKQYVQREATLHKNITDNKSAYTASSYTNYLKSRNPDDLVIAGKPTKMGDNLFVPGMKNLMPSVTRDGVAYVRVDLNGDGRLEEVEASKLGAMKPINNLHNPSEVNSQFLKTLTTIEGSLNKGADKQVGVASDSVASQASDLYFAELARYGRTPSEANRIKGATKKALEKWAAALHQYKTTGEGEDPSLAFESFYLNERVIDRIGVERGKFGDTSVKNLATIINDASMLRVNDSEGNTVLMTPEQTQQYFDKLLRIYNYAKNNNKNMHGFKDDEVDNWNGFGWFLHSLQKNPNDVNNPAVQLYNENKENALKGGK